MPCFHCSDQSTFGSGACRRVASALAASRSARSSASASACDSDLRDDRFADFLNSLRASFEQRGDHGVALRARADAHRHPRAGLGSRAERFFHLRPEALAATVGRNTGLNSPSRATSCRSSSVRRSGVQSCTRTCRSPVPPAFTRGKPRPAQMEQLPALRSGRNRHATVAGDSRHAELRAEHELRVRDEHFGVEILAVALEPRVIGNLEQHVDVAARRRLACRHCRRRAASCTARRHARRECAP